MALQSYCDGQVDVETTAVDAASGLVGGGAGALAKIVSAPLKSSVLRVAIQGGTQGLAQNSTKQELEVLDGRRQNFDPKEAIGSTVVSALTFVGLNQASSLAQRYFAKVQAGRAERTALILAEKERQQVQAVLAEIDTEIPPKELFRRIPDRLFRDELERYRETSYQFRYHDEFQPAVQTFLRIMDIAPSSTFEGKFQIAFNLLANELRGVESHPGHIDAKRLVQQFAGARLVYDTLANVGKRLNVHIPNLKFGEYGDALNDMFRHIAGAP